MAAYADKEGLRRDDLSNLSVIVSCGINLSHSVAGDFVSQRHNPVIKLFFNVRIACSAALRLWTCGGTNWYFTSAMLKACFI